MYGRVKLGGRRSKLTPQQRADIAEDVLSGRRTAAQMARLYAVSQSMRPDPRSPSWVYRSNPGPQLIYQRHSLRRIRNVSPRAG
jgi:hypothetical protein